MTPERWRRAKTMFWALVDLDAEHQERMLADLCGVDDRQLQDEVRELLTSYRDRGFVDELAARLGDHPGAPTLSATVSGRIGRYEVIEQIGEGGMGVVYKARDPQLDRLVAVKLISPARRLDNEWRQRLVLEARAAAALDHPCIATVYEIGQMDDGTPFLAMAFYEGETLAACLKRGRLPVADAVRIGREIARGLAAAHARGITHRDLKPANVLLTRSSDVKIVDFGIAKMPGVEQTQTGVVLGSIAYMAPEQIRGEKVDPPADIWAFGVLLSEMLTGQRPSTSRLHDGSPAAPAPSSIRPEIPATLDRIVERALAARPADRYSDGLELLAALEYEPELRTASASESDRRFQLPEPITRFFGRQQEVDDVLRRVGDARLSTLTGPGGTGKTRLALQVAALAHDRFKDGVVFVSLAAIVDPTLVCTEIAHVLAVPERPAISPADSLAAFLNSRQMLLVLDNFEHVVSAAPEILVLLTRCAQLRILVTSRVPLRVAGEHEYPVPPLTHPPPQARMTATLLERFAATALFLDRARAVCPALATLGDDQAGAVAEICTRLDGLPLAIELAAVRAKLFSPIAMLRRLERPLDLLKLGSRDQPARHQSLRQAIAWSYDLLTPEQQAVFRWLAVFSGGCGLDDATAILAAHQHGIGDVTDACAALVDHSLVVREDDPDGLPRLRMLETIREFALERLDATAEAHNAHRAHANHYAALAEEAEPHLTRSGQAVWFDRLEIEHDNLRAALSWTQTHGQTSMGLRLGAALWRFWAARGHLREGYEHLARLLAMTGAEQPTLLRARVLNASATLVHEISDLAAARPLVEESLAIARGLGDRALVALVLNNLAFLLVRVGESETAQTCCEEALALNRELADHRGVAVALYNLALLMDLRGEYDRACALNEESLAQRQAHGDTRGVAYAAIELARTEVRRHGFERASALLEDARSTLERLGDRQLLAWALTNQGRLERAAGRSAAALERYAASVDLWRAVGNDWGLGFSLVGDAEAALDVDAGERAARELDEALPLLRRTGGCFGLSDGLKARARLAEKEGDWKRAGAFYAEALELYLRMGDPEPVRECREALARVANPVDAIHPPARRH
jgi:predicted ATPase/tRNA A-37 threonylcarbamoyl transferase component Bud32